MESILTVRLDSDVKDRGSAIMKENGLTPSQAVRKLFDYAIKNDALPFRDDGLPDKASIRKKIASFDALRISTPASRKNAEAFDKPLSQLSDDDIKAARMRERYGIDDR